MNNSRRTFIRNTTFAALGTTLFQQNLFANAKKLPFRDNEFDLVISIKTIHNLNQKDCGVALREIERVSKKNSFITVDAYSNIKEKKRMFAWNLTAKTILSKKQWINFFKKNNYTGDYYWFVP
jgi:ubiquinone/menaquinone biosynthesis C-methylase UbiE